MKRIIVLTLSVILCFPLLSQEFSAKTDQIYLKLQANAPELQWLNPANDNLVSANKSIVIKLKAETTSPIADVDVFLNGEEIQMSRGISLGGNTSREQIIEQQVNLMQGNNEIRVVVENEQGGIAESVKNVSYNVLITDRTDYALIFAVNDYDEWGDLTNPVFDAQAVEEEIREYYGFKTELVINPKKVDVLTKLREYAGKSYQPKDQLMIFFAGHGKFDEITRMGYLATVDSKISDEVSDSYISHSAYRDYINNIPNQHILVVIDACFGGTFDQALARAGSRGQDNQYYELTKTEFIERKLKYQTRKYLTSGGKQYVPDGRPGAHSPFARKFLEALRNYGGSDKILTYTELMTYFEALTPMPRSGEFGANEPGSDFVFVSN
jgi:hypothetical protein